MNFVVEAFKNININIKSLSSCFMILFAVINPIGNLAVIIGLKKKLGKEIDSIKAAFACLILMLLFLFLGNYILSIFGLDINSFAIAGGIVLFILGLEMLLGVSFFKLDIESYKVIPLIPVAFPMFIGAGTFTTLVTLKSDYGLLHVIIAALLNNLIIYLIIKYSTWIEKKIGNIAVIFIQKMMGTVILAIAIKLIKLHLFFK